MKVKKHCPKCGFPFIYMNDVCYCTDAGGIDMGYRTKEQQRLIDSVALEFGNFETFQLGKGIKKVLKYNTYITDLGRKFQTFIVNEVIERIEKPSFTLKCSTRAMAFLETLYCYSRIKMGVGQLTLASCDIILEIDFDLAGTTIMYPVIDPKSEQTFKQTLTRVLIAE